MTQPLISNYGGILQNFALQKALKKMGYEVETINRIESRGTLHTYLRKIKQYLLKHTNDKILTNRQIYICGKFSRRFINSYITKIDIVNPTDSKLLKIVQSHNYDTVIVGSDQVWRPKYAIDIYHDYLSFLENNSDINKVAYAASLGTDDWEYSDSESFRCSDLSKQFNAISVREKSAIDLLFDKLGVNSCLVVDPTLLLKKEDYISIISAQGKTVTNKNGIYTYILDRSGEKQKIIDRVAELRGDPVFSSQPNVMLKGARNIPFSEKEFIYPPIEDWLNGFYTGDFIITDSFHGTVFSIIFNKPFIAIANRERGKARFLSLLSLFGLESRLVESFDDIHENLINETIDFEVVNQKVDEMRNVSYNFIKQNV
ncbi:polysaccharide pyruvyl transferase family protein [Myroides sp. LJL119]